MSRLRQSEWLPLAPEKPARIRVNHQSPDCDGGRDSMIIERRRDGTANAYCFRCGRSGWHCPTRYFKLPEASASGSGRGGDVACTAASKLLPPKDATGEWGRFPRVAKEWLLKGGLTSVRCAEQGVLWSESKEKLWLPVKQHSKTTTGSKLAGYVERGFNPKSYITRTDDKANFFGYYICDTPSVINNTKIVLVEDVVSALKCSQVVDSVAILGVHPKESAISCILNGGYKEAYIFLDADNPTVRMKAREIPKRLPFIKCHIIETGLDPKEHPISDIQELIK